MRIPAILFCLSVLAVFIALSGEVRAQNTFPMSMPMHGNWCGPGHPRDSWEALPPIDPLDEACMRHDFCVAQRGQGDCGCDIAFLQELRHIPWPNPSISAKARAIYDSMCMMPCTNPFGWAEKKALFMEEWWTDTMTGTRPPWDVFLRWGYLGLDTMDRKFREGKFP